MQAVQAQVSSKHQVVIPKAVRELLDIRPQQSVLFLIDGDRVCLRPKPRSFTQQLCGLHADLWPQPAEEWLAEERATWK